MASEQARSHISERGAHVLAHHGVEHLVDHVLGLVHVRRARREARQRPVRRLEERARLRELAHEPPPPVASSPSLDKA